MKTNKGLIFFTGFCLFLSTFLLLISVEPNVCQKQPRTLLARPEASAGDEASRTFANIGNRRPPRPTRHRRHRARPNKPRASSRKGRSNTVRVRTRIGEIEGAVIDVHGKKVHAFLGVPFAEPPIGPLRFKAPVPAQPRSGIIRANKPAKSCYQSADFEYKFRGADMWNAKTEKSEDCLYMNIWAPADADNATSMVWLFGGGFWYGSASLGIYNGLGLAAEGKVIVVNPNYRMGAFGFLFLDHAEVPGNMGLLDQQMAMRWIQENIAAFGGDPNKVNLFGESAGAASIVAHMVAPDSWSLFNNGILQSGSLDNPWSMDTPAKAEARSRTVVSAAGCSHARMADTVKCLRNKTAPELDEAMWHIHLNYLEFPLVIVSRDRAGFFRQDAYQALREGRYRPRTDLMFGINQDEGTFWMAYYELKQYFHPFNDTGGGDEKWINVTRFTDSITNVILKDKPHAYKNAALWEYRDTQCSIDKPTFYRDQLNQLIGDYFFTCDSLWLADDVVRRNKGRVFVYHFEQRISSNPWPRWMGVMHGYEIEYIFGLPLLHQNHHQSFLPAYDNGNNRHYYNYTPEDRVFSKDIIQYWTSFAKTGIPRSRNQNSRKADWPAYDLEDKAWYILKARNTGRHVLHKQKENECKLWRSIRDVEYRLYEATHLSGATSMSFRLHTLLTVTTIGYLLVT